ncbi:hypothetical protein C5167_041776 [Papaver somniferum]|nr:hypothetical protein C5167_041776 [Papaver somniferum]
MARFSPIISFIFVLFIFASGENMIHMTEADERKCTIGGPACTDSTICNSYCNGIYQGGVGSCNLIVGTPLRFCLCVFDCPVEPPKPRSPPGPPKRCNSGGPACTNFETCNSYCSGLHQGGVGTCDSITGTPQRLCLCQFDCNPDAKAGSSKV